VLPGSRLATPALPRGVGPPILVPVSASHPASAPVLAGIDTHPERAPLSRTELLLILGFWTLIAVLTSGNYLLEPRGNPWQPAYPFVPALMAFTNAYLWAALTPPIFWLASRFTIERSHWGTRVMFVIMGLVLAVGVDLAMSVLRSQLYKQPAYLTPELLAIARLRRLWFMNEFFVFVAVLSAGYARNYFLRYRLRREEAILLKSQAAHLQAQLADARLAALRTQLNPHFLFNTLHAVSALVERDPRGVRRMVARLSELLRTSLDESDEPEVPLQREISFIERYLDVMQIRFQGKLEVQMNIDPQVRDALVPNLILQPLVENAVKHGVTKLVGIAGSIEISARRERNRVVLSVRDNGPGMGAGQSGNAEGLGLRNTRLRLMQLYGPEQSLTLRSPEGGGFIAEVILPFHTHADLRTAAVAAEA